MARQVIHQLIDDLDGGEADQTVRFSLDGVAYEIDLSDGNAVNLREALAPFIAAGSRVGKVGTGGITPRRVGPARNTRADNQAIREWAANTGRRINDRGRIPVEVVEAYNAAQRQPAPEVKPPTPAPKGKGKGKPAAAFSGKP